LADEVAEVRLVLVPVALDEPFYEILPLVGLMGCGAGAAGATTSYHCGNANHYVAFDTNVTSDLVAIIDELQWQQTSSFAATSLRLVMGFEETCNPCSFEHSYGDVEGPSPVRLVAQSPFRGISGGEGEDLFQVRHRVWVPAGSDELPFVVVVLEQRFDLYVTHFYGQPPAEDYSALPDA
jgi:hypothetical protein